MHLAVVTVATFWMTVLLAITIVVIIRARSTTLRILSVDAMTLVLVALLVLFSASRQQSFYLDAALAISLFAFIGTTVAARRLAAERVL